MVCNAIFIINDGSNENLENYYGYHSRFIKSTARLTR